MKLRVRTYLVLAFIIATGAPLAVFWSWPYSRALEAEMADVRERNLLIAQNLASTLDAYHRELTALLAAFGGLIAEGRGQEAKPLFEALHFRNVCVADAVTGRVSVAYPVAGPPCPQVLAPERLELVRRLAADRDPGVSGVFRPAGEQARIFVATRAGPHLLVGAVDTDFFRALRDQVRFGRDGHAVIVDRKGGALAHPLEERHDEIIDLSDMPLVRRMQAGESGIDTFFSPVLQQPMIAGFTAVGDVGWGVMVSQPIEELEENASRFDRGAFVVLSIGFALSLLMALAVSMQLSRRLGGMAMALHDLAQQRDGVRVQASWQFVEIRELMTLENDINRLARESEAARAAQDRYNRDLEMANANLRREMAERRTAEAARETSEIRFRSLFESAPIPIREEDLSGMKRMIDALNIPDPAEFARYLDRNPDFLDACSREIVVVDANRASLEQHGYTDKSEMLAKVVRELSPAAKKIVRMTVETLHSGGKGRSYETRITRADGSVRTVAATWSVIPGYEDSYARILLSSVDLTERLKSEEALRQAQKMEAVGQLTGGVAHDFNNLLTVIGGNVDLMEETRTVDAELTALIRKAVRRGAELTQRLLAFSRKQPLSPQPIHLGELVQGMTELLRRSLGEEIAVRIELEEPLWRAIADPGQVEAALLNMALNSRDAMPGGGTLTIASRNAVVGAGDGIDAAPGDYVVLSITDTGTGMTPDVVARAYEPFFTTKEVGKGTGLGLSTVYGFAKQSGGDVRIESQPGQGTTISLYLPRTVAPRDAFDQQEGLVRQIDGRGMTVLVLEDDPGVLHYLVKLMETYRFRVLTAADVASARAALSGVLGAGGSVDLLISDVMLPGGVRGPEFAAELLGRSPSTGIIFISGRPSEAKIEAVHRFRHALVLPKPFSREDLAELIEIALRARKDPG